jgi:hypothetical protein
MAVPHEWAAALESGVVERGCGHGKCQYRFDLGRNWHERDHRLSRTDNSHAERDSDRGPNGSRGAGVSVDYSVVHVQLAAIGFASTPGGPLPLTLGSTIDTGTRVENINSGALPASLGIGLGQARATSASRSRSARVRALGTSSSSR